MDSLPILYRDDHLIAVHKPAGLLIHRTRIAEADDFLLQRLRNQIGRRVYPVHRLDRPTSGVVLFALDGETARRVATQFEARQVSKAYLAVVRGYTEEQGRIDYALQEEPGRERQQAVTDYERLARVELPFPVGRYASARYSLLRVRPVTGRLHQIRKHLKHIFHPLVGDTTHGDGRQNDFFRSHFQCHRLLLMAAGLTLTHPYGGEPLSLHADLEAEPEWAALCASLGWLAQWELALRAP